MEAVIWILMGLAGGFVAKEKNRNVGLWIILRIFFGILSLIVVCCLKKLPREKVELKNEQETNEDNRYR